MHLSQFRTVTATKLTNLHLRRCVIIDQGDEVPQFEESLTMICESFSWIFKKLVSGILALECRVKLTYIQQYDYYSVERNRGTNNKLGSTTVISYFNYYSSQELTINKLFTTLKIPRTQHFCEITYVTVSQVYCLRYRCKLLMKLYELVSII